VFECASYNYNNNKQVSQQDAYPTNTVALIPGQPCLGEPVPENDRT